MVDWWWERKILLVTTSLVFSAILAHFLSLKKNEEKKMKKKVYLCTLKFSHFYWVSLFSFVYSSVPVKVRKKKREGRKKTMHNNVWTHLVNWTFLLLTVSSFFYFILFFTSFFFLSLSLFNKFNQRKSKRTYVCNIFIQIHYICSSSKKKKPISPQITDHKCWWPKWWLIDCCKNHKWKCL